MQDLIEEVIFIIGEFGQEELPLRVTLQQLDHLIVNSELKPYRFGKLFVIQFKRMIDLMLQILFLLMKDMVVALELYRAI
jgi:hypothetical protein